MGHIDAYTVPLYPGRLEVKKVPIVATKDCTQFSRLNNVMHHPQIWLGMLGMPCLYVFCVPSNFNTI